MDVLASILNIEKACFDDAWSESIVSNMLENNYYVWSYEKIDDKIVGYAVCSVSCDEAELQRIAVLSDFRGRKIGEKLISDILRKLKDGGVAKVFLEVDAQNEVAINLYKKHNFTEIGRRKNYYGEGKDAINMLAFIA